MNLPSNMANTKILHKQFLNALASQCTKEPMGEVQIMADELKDFYEQAEMLEAQGYVFSPEAILALASGEYSSIEKLDYDEEDFIGTLDKWYNDMME